MYVSIGWPAMVLLPIIFWWLKVVLVFVKLLCGLPSLNVFVESLIAVSRLLPSILSSLT
jgi:hypothetical protein